MAETPSVQPLTCCLSAGAYRNRIAWIQSLTRRALRSHVRDDLVLRLAYAPEAAADVQKMVEQERKCCAFLTFDLKEEADCIRVTITVPQAARDSADMLFGHFLATRSAAPLTYPHHFHNHGDMKKSEVLAALAALAQETRLDIYRLLVQAGEGGLAAGKIGDELGLPSATLAFHLKELKHAGLVMFTREGRSLIYAAVYPTMNGLLAYLTENCCGRPSSVGPPVCLPRDAKTRQPNRSA